MDEYNETAGGKTEREPERRAGPAPVSADAPDKAEPQDAQGRKDAQDAQGRKDAQDAQDRKDTQDAQDWKDAQGRKDAQGAQDWQELDGQQAMKELQNLHDLEESLDSLGDALRKVAQSLESLADARTAFSRIGWAAFIMTPVSLFLQWAGAVILTRFVPGWADTWLLWAVSFAPMYAVATPLALWILGTVPAHPPERRPLGFWRTAALFPAAVALTYAGNAVSLGTLYFMSRVFGTSAENPLLDLVLNENAPLLRAVVMVCVAPIAEEYLFRKTVLDRARVYGEKLALMVSALLFALEHGNLSQFVYALLLGLAFGYIYLRTGRLWYTIALHMFLNFIGGVAAPLVMQRMGDGEISGSAAAMVFSAVILLFCGGGVAILADNWRRIRFVPMERELPPAVRLRIVCANPGMILLAVSFVITSALILIL